MSLAQVPSGSTILAGTDSAGLFRSGDSGRTWHNVAEMGRTLVRRVTFSDPDGSTAYAVTGRGLFETDDGGESWQRVARIVSGRLDALALTSQGDVYVGTGDGALFRRKAGGDAWKRWGAGIGVKGLLSSLVVASPTRWYAGTERGLYLSDDGGLTWRLAQPGPGRPQATALAMTSDGSLLLGTNDGLFRWNDAGLRWEPSSDGLPGDIALALAPALSKPGVIYAGLASNGLYRSSDGGRRWSATGWTRPGTPAVLVDPDDSDHVYIRVAYERVYESRDGGATWTPRWDGLSLSTQIISLAMDPGRPSTLYAGGTEGLFRSLDAASHWQAVGPELGGQTIFCTLVDPEDWRNLYLGATNGTYRSRDGGEHWAQWGQGLEGVTVTALAFSPQDRDVVYAGAKYRGVYVSVDGGQQWEPAGLDALSVNGFLLTLDGKWLYLASDAGVYRMKVGPG